MIFYFSINKEKITRHVDAFIDNKLQISADDILNLEKVISEDDSNQRTNESQASAAAVTTTQQVLFTLIFFLKIFSS